MKSKEIAEALKEHTRTLGMYPIPIIEKFCNDNDLTVNEFMELEAGCTDLSRAYLIFKQKQKQLVFQLLALDGESFPITTGDGKSLILDKNGVMYIAKDLGFI